MFRGKGMSGRQSSHCTDERSSESSDMLERRAEITMTAPCLSQGCRRRGSWVALAAPVFGCVCMRIVEGCGCLAPRD